MHLGRAFFGESMFSKARDASKIALVYLVARLKFGGFELLDTQFVTGHLARFGAIEVGRAEFQRLLEDSALLPQDGNVGGGGELAVVAWAAPWAAAGGGAAACAGAGATAAGFGAAAAAGFGAGAAAGASAAGAAGAAAFCSLPAGATGAEVLQLVSQTSKTGCSTA